jgi:hypothetical protein
MSPRAPTVICRDCQRSMEQRSWWRRIGVLCFSRPVALKFGDEEIQFLFRQVTQIAFEAGRDGGAETRHIRREGLREAPSFSFVTWPCSVPSVVGLAATMPSAFRLKQTRPSTGMNAKEQRGATGAAIGDVAHTDLIHFAERIFILHGREELLRLLVGDPTPRLPWQRLDRGGEQGFAPSRARVLHQQSGPSDFTNEFVSVSKMGIAASDR